MSVSSDAVQIKLSAMGLTDVGLLRKNNEDAFWADCDLGVFAVADGMGGAQAGEVAAAMAIAGLQKRLAAAPDAAYLSSPTLENRRLLLNHLAKAVDEINAEIYEHASLNSECRGMGCTLDVVLVRGRGVFLAHVGDSRVYGLREKQLYQLTEDHTFAQTMLNAGVLTADELKVHPQRNVLMRALGVYPNVQVDTAYIDVIKNDIFMLCSDGVHGLLTAEQIGRAMAAGPNLAAQALIKLALAAGGRDNATAVEFKVDLCAAPHPIGVGSEEIRRAMAQASLFGGFTESELLRVQRITIGRVLAPGEVVTRRNEPCNDLFLVIAGAMAGFEDDRRVATLNPGDPFGAMSLHTSPATLTFKADGPTNILVFPLHELHLLLRSDTAIAAKLAMNSLERVWQRYHQLVDLAIRRGSSSAS